MSALYLPPWTVNYSYTVSPNQSRSSGPTGFRTQAKKSHRVVKIANVTRTLRNSEISYWLYYIDAIVNNGYLKYTDKYQDDTGIVTGTVRIVEGTYSVQMDNNMRAHTVNCEIELL